MLRSLGWSDAWFCYELAKDPAVRTASLICTPPKLFGHLRWMWRRIHDGQQIAWIIMYGKKRAGLIRYHKQTKEIGIAIAENYRGRGLALDALLSASPYFYRVGGRVKAIVKMGNTVSVRLFERAGYHEVSAPAGTCGYLFMEWIPE